MTNPSHLPNELNSVQNCVRADEEPEKRREVALGTVTGPSVSPLPVT